MVTERKHLKMHTKLLLDVIKRQAGTLHKAVLEGVMNAIEAGATRVDINFTATPTPKLVISDNGKGIQTVGDIERFFETFGTPHRKVRFGRNSAWGAVSCSRSARTFGLLVRSK